MKYENTKSVCKKDNYKDAEYKRKINAKYTNKNAVEMQWKLNNKRTGWQVLPKLSAIDGSILSAHQSRIKSCSCSNHYSNIVNVYMSFHNFDFSNRFNPKREIESNLLTFAPLEIPRYGQ